MPRHFSVLLVVTFLAVTAQHAHPTSCIQNKPFKVKKVCGVVVAPEGTPMSHVRVELVDPRTELPDFVQAVETDNEGAFILSNVKPGEYGLRVRLSGFATASQNIAVTAHDRSSRCKRPIRVHMQVAGRCSSISMNRKQ